MKLKNIFFIFILFCLSFSCKDGNDKDSKIIQFDEKESSATNSLKANKNEIADFFGINDNLDGLNHLFFYDYKDSLYDFENDRSKEKALIRRINVEDETLKGSRIINKRDFSVLILDNPAETSVALFYKDNGKEVGRMIENKHYPDSIFFHELNDTLLVCQYYWKYDFGSDLSNIRHYYFIGEKQGVFNYGCNSVNKKLKFENFITKNSENMTSGEESEGRIIISPDTLIGVGASSFTSIFKPNYVNFEKVIFSEF